MTGKLFNPPSFSQEIRRGKIQRRCGTPLSLDTFRREQLPTSFPPFLFLLLVERRKETEEYNDFTSFLPGRLSGLTKRGGPSPSLFSPPAELKNWPPTSPPPFPFPRQSFAQKEFLSSYPPPLPPSPLSPTLVTNQEEGRSKTSPPHPAFPRPLNIKTN